MLPLTIDFRPDITVLALTGALVLVAGFATGLVPGLYSSTPNLAGALSGEIAVGGTRKGRIRNGLVVIQVAVCTPVLIGVGLCVQSLRNLRQVNPGFSARKVAILTTDLQYNGYSEEQGRNLHARMRVAASQLYGVESISLSNDIPLNGGFRAEQVRAEGLTAQSQKDDGVSYMTVDGDFFSTLGIPLLAGRVFEATDTAKSPEVIIINRLMAQKYWPGQDAVGKTARLGEGNRVVTVVGVVGDGKYIDLEELTRPFMYLDSEQHYQSVFYLLLRTRGNPNQWLKPASEALQKLDPQLSVQTLTMNDWMQLALYIPWITLICIGAFGGLAFVLAAVGRYGAVFYSVSERKKELGIRVALGAEPSDLWRMILRQTSVVTFLGACLGILGGTAAGALVRSLLYGIRPVEWVVFVAVAFTMGAMTALTAYSAARPWMRADPMESVRHA